MSIENIVAVVMLVAAAIGIIGIRIYTMHKNNQAIDFDTFISTYSEQIIKVLQDAIVLLQINVNDFKDKESYDKAIISTTITKLKENSVEFGIDESIINLFDTASLTEVIYKIFDNNLVKVFSIVDANTICSKPELYDNIVVEAVSEV